MLDKETEETDRWTKRQKDIHTDKQTDKIEKRTGRQTER